MLILGAGETGERTVRALNSRGVTDIRVSNRSPERAEKLATLVQGRAVPFEQWAAQCGEIDILISSTSADEPLLTPARLEPMLRVRANRPLFIIDIAVPRDVAPEVNEMEGVYLYDIDSLQSIAEQSLAMRREQMAAAEKIIGEHVADFSTHLSGAEVRAASLNRAGPGVRIVTRSMSAGLSKKLVLGSRGSELARCQSAMVEAALRQLWPQLEMVTRIISTRGDLRTAEPVDQRSGRKGLFTGEIERALAAGEIDLAVHSAKDLPSGMTRGLELVSVLPRAAGEDVLISKAAANQARGVIATGSVRRRHQLQWQFPGVEVVDLRGNVPTRLRKLLENDWEAVVLARAGLERLGYDLSADTFDFEGATLHVQPPFRK